MELADILLQQLESELESFDEQFPVTDELSIDDLIDFQLASEVQA